MNNYKSVNIYIETLNDAFQEDNEEIKRILQGIIYHIDSNGLQDVNVKDIMGNTVGHFSVEENITL